VHSVPPNGPTPLQVNLVLTVIKQRQMKGLSRKQLINHEGIKTRWKLGKWNPFWPPASATKRYLAHRSKLERLYQNKNFILWTRKVKEHNNVLLSSPWKITLNLKCLWDTNMRNTYCLSQIKFITEYPNVQHVIITQI